MADLQHAMLGQERPARRMGLVESAVWIAAALALLMTAVDFGAVWWETRRMHAAAEVAALALAEDRITPPESDQVVRHQLGWPSEDDLSLSIIDGDEVSVRISRPARLASPFGIYDILMSGEVTARASVPVRRAMAAVAGG